MAISIEKPPVTSSNCYETIKKASYLIKLSTNVDPSNGMLNLKFPTITMSGHLKIAEYFGIDFSIKTDKCSATSQWFEIESKAFLRWLHVTLRSTSGYLSVLQVHNLFSWR
jgi:hypothetical protein